MARRFRGIIACLAAVALSGCGSGGLLTPSQKVLATKQWNSTRVSALASLAADQYREGVFDKCQATIDQALSLEPDNVGLHLLAAKLAIEQGKLEVAEANLNQLQWLDPQNAETNYLLGVVYQRWQQPDQARAAYANAFRKNPAELSYLLGEAEMTVAAGHAKAALALLESNQNTFEHSGVLRDEMGQLLVGEKRYPDAILKFQEASRLSTDDPTIREHLAFALFFAKRYPEAEQEFERVIRDPESDKRGDIHAAMGECQAQALRTTEAQKNYQIATEVQPTCSGYWLGLAKVAMQLNDLGSADVAVRKAVSLDKKSSEAQCLLGYVRLKQNNLPLSLAAFQMAAALDPHDSVSLCLQGYLLTRMNRKAEAAPLYVQALKMNPDNALVATLATAGE